MPHNAGYMHVEQRSPPAIRKRPSSTKMTPPSTSGSLWRSLLVLSPLFTLLPWLCVKMHYKLPTPRGDGLGVSEINIMEHIQALENIGYRTVGTEEAVAGEVYVYERVKELQQRCNAAGVMSCDVWWQQGDGLHQFDIMGHAVLKSYQGISNIILRIADPNSTHTIDGTPMRNAVLLNAHIDSALPSRGAADDGIGVGVMLDVARVLIDRNQPIAGAAIFLFNGAEETLQDASHLYSTQHETAPTVKTVINLEAAGTTGPALLFQATSKEMIEAYAHVPRPHTTVVAADVFSSGIILSDTDFVQFEKYLNISGLDIATTGHSYYYHTRKDSVENIERGSAQHMADSTIAVLDHLLVEGSPLNTDSPWSPPDLVYYSLYDAIYVHYSVKAATYIYGATALVFVALLVARMHGGWRTYAKAIAGAFGSFFAGLIAALFVAVFLRYGLGRGQSWFWHEHLPVVLFGLPALTASYTFQHWLFRRPSPHVEHASAYGALALPIILMVLLQAFHIRSAYLFFNVASAGLVLLACSEGVAMARGRCHHVNFAFGYFAWTTTSMVFAVEGTTAFLDIFVPLTGRMGKEAPTEIIIAVLSAFCTYVFMPTLVPFFHRWSRDTQRKIILFLLLASTITIAIFASWMPYNAEHPKRIGVQFMYNTTSHSQVLHVAQLDSGPGFQDILGAIHNRYGDASYPVTPNVRSEVNGDWDVLYPISAFIEAEKFTLPPGEATEHSLPQVKIDVVEDSYDASAKERTVRLKVAYPGLVYPVIAFTAEVVTWDFLSAPPVGRTRHYVKSASSPGFETFEMVMTLACEDEHERLDLHWVGIGKFDVAARNADANCPLADIRQMFPATANHLGADLPASRMFVDMDAWMEHEWKGALEVLMIGSVGGVMSL